MAEILDGKAASAAVRAQLKEEVEIGRAHV